LVVHGVDVAAVDLMAVGRVDHEIAETAHPAVSAQEMLKAVAITGLDMPKTCAEPT
jgi:hypothetical protein